MKLHLGCGQKYLEGYVNIDLPSDDIFPRKVDLVKNLTELKYSAGSIEEVRNHHVFEHFMRPIACALLVSWNSWLKEDGTLHIEVPDYFRTSLEVFNPFNSFKKQGVGIRHVFGSHEAPWAVHAEGYTPKSLKMILNSFGFEVIRVHKFSWRGTFNVEMIAKKVKNIESLEHAKISCEKYLSNFTVDDTPGELKILDIWLDSFLRQVKISTELK